MASVEELAAALQQLQQQVVATQADNQVLRERLATYMPRCLPNTALVAWR